MMPLMPDYSSGRYFIFRKFAPQETVICIDCGVAFEYWMRGGEVDYHHRALAISFRCQRCAEKEDLKVAKRKLYDQQISKTFRSGLAVGFAIGVAVGLVARAVMG